ncbi:unnamed protein product [Prunus armeniaca]
MMKLSYHGVSMVLPITSLNVRKQVLLTYKRKRQSRTDPVHECRNSLFVAPDDTSLRKPPYLQVHLIDKRSSENYNRNSAVRF